MRSWTQADVDLERNDRDQRLAELDAEHARLNRGVVLTAGECRHLDAVEERRDAERERLALLSRWEEGDAPDADLDAAFGDEPPAPEPFPLEARWIDRDVRFARRDGGDDGEGYVVSIVRPGPLLRSGGAWVETPGERVRLIPHALYIITPIEGSP